MALELDHLQLPTIFLATSCMTHLLLPFAFYWTGNLAISYQKPYTWGLAIKSFKVF